jgi:hypothetical protein
MDPVWAPLVAPAAIGLDEPGRSAMTRSAKGCLLRALAALGTCPELDNNTGGVIRANVGGPTMTLKRQRYVSDMCCAALATLTTRPSAVARCTFPCTSC